MAIVTVLVAVILAISLQDHPKKAVVTSKCGAYRNDKTVTIGSTKIQAEATRTPADLQKGLGDRPCIEANKGMLFTFDHPGHYPFWMKDMKFPIDIIWIGADHKVAGVEIDVQPSTYPDHFVNKDNLAQYVLELHANRSKELNVNIGTPVNF